MSLEIKRVYPLTQQSHFKVLNEEKEKHMSTKYLYRNAYRNFIYKNQKLEKPRLINRTINKQIMVYTYNRIARSNKKKQTTDTLNNTDEYQKHYPLRKELDAEEYI